MNQRVEIIEQTKGWVKEKLAHDYSGHDWDHIQRVHRNALLIAKDVEVDVLVIELAALLHDAVDEKLFLDVEQAYRDVRALLEQFAITTEQSEHVITILRGISFKGGQQPPLKTMEGHIVQDADRLDAIGAIGVARTFTYGGSKGHRMYDEELAVRDHMTAEEYRKNESTPIHHFYEKLLKLKDLMNTDKGRELAEERHAFMEQFLQQFLKEWNGLA